MRPLFPNDLQDILAVDKSILRHRCNTTVKTRVRALEYLYVLRQTREDMFAGDIYEMLAYHCAFIASEQ